MPFTQETQSFTPVVEHVPLYPPRLWPDDPRQDQYQLPPQLAAQQPQAAQPVLPGYDSEESESSGPDDAVADNQDSPSQSDDNGDIQIQRPPRGLNSSALNTSALDDDQYLTGPEVWSIL